MTTTYVQIGSLQEFQDRMQLMGDNAEKMIQESVYIALNGDVRSAIKKMTPRSSTSRYGKTYDKDGKEIKKKFTERSKTKQKASGQSGTLRNSFRLEIKGNDEIQIGHTAPYAGYVHDAKKPLLGDYWEPGKKGGWTTHGTGPKFVESILTDAKDVIPENAVHQLDKMLKQAGII